jgi:hypothetical protein
MDSTETPQNQPTVSATSRVPPELIDAIIDAGNDDKRFLKTCGLVCRAWVPASRRRLFESVTLHNRNTGDFDLLMQSELVTIPRHVRHLCLLPPSYQYVLGNASLLSQLAFVKSLLLSFINTKRRIGSLEHGIGYFRFLAQLSISHCHFDTFNDLANVLLSCATLEDLELVETSWPPTSESVPVAGSLPSLRRLTIWFVCAPEEITAWLLSLQPVPALHSFIFRYDDWTENPAYLPDTLLNTLLKTLGPSLQHLDIDDLDEQKSYSCTLPAL